MTLGPAQEALLADARAQAARVLDQAERDARRVLAGARRDARERIAAARAHGEAEGRLDAATALARERSLARMEVLAARRELYDLLRLRARTAVLELRREPGYPELQERLIAAVRRDLGDRAHLEVDPPGAGGVRGRAGTVEVDYTLPTLARRCIDDRIGSSVRRLWL